MLAILSIKLEFSRLVLTVNIAYSKHYKHNIIKPLCIIINKSF